MHDVTKYIKNLGVHNIITHLNEEQKTIIINIKYYKCSTGRHDTGIYCTISPRIIILLRFF